MATRLVHLVIDSADPHRIGQFWADALGWIIGIDDQDEVEVLPPGFVYPGPTALPLDFVLVTDPKTTKNRVHLDLVVEDLDAATAEIESLGGRWLEPGITRDLEGFQWRIMADPEGNEFDIDVLPPE